MNTSKKMMDNLTVRVPAALLEEFEDVIKNDRTGNKNKSNIVRSCVEAYIQLVKRANGRSLPALEFRGFESTHEQASQFFPTTRALAVAEPRTAEHATIGRTKK